MSISPSNISSLAFWRNLHLVKERLIAAEASVTDFDSDPVGTLERHGIDIMIDLDGDSGATSFIEMLSRCSGAQRDAITRYIRPFVNSAPASMAVTERAMASGASSVSSVANVSTVANAVSVANAAVASAATANVVAVVNAAVVSNVLAVAAVIGISPPTVDGG
jgi:hypothetical protein